MPHGYPLSACVGYIYIELQPFTHFYLFPWFWRVAMHPDLIKYTIRSPVNILASLTCQYQLTITSNTCLKQGMFTVTNHWSYFDNKVTKLWVCSITNRCKNCNISYWNQNWIVKHHLAWGQENYFGIHVPYLLDGINLMRWLFSCCQLLTILHGWVKASEHGRKVETWHYSCQSQYVLLLQHMTTNSRRFWMSVSQISVQFSSAFCFQGHMAHITYMYVIQ